MRKTFADDGKDMAYIRQVFQYVLKCETFSFIQRNCLFHAEKLLVSHRETLCFTTRNFLFHAAKQIVSHHETI